LNKEKLKQAEIEKQKQLKKANEVKTERVFLKKND